jgi:signal transduction histidine kinase
LDGTLDHAPVIGDRSLIERMTANLLENAIRHNIQSGTVTIATRRTIDRTQLSIKNSGPVIKPADVQRLLQPFQRLAPARTQHTDGHGLGLAIANAIANAHHATLTVTALPEGGLDVTVAFHAPAVTPNRDASTGAVPSTCF